MKRPGLSPALVAATLFLVSAAFAADAAKPLPAMAANRGAELLKRFDKNGDGKLDAEELADGHETMLQEQLARQAAVAAAPRAPQFQARMLELFDKNHDGRLDDEERLEVRKYAEEHGLGPDGEVREELVRRFDRNADGKLDDAERAEMQKFLQERRGPVGQPPGAMRESLLRQFDRNADGRIDDTEMADLERAMRPRIESSPPQLQRYDKNSDGRLDDGEWAAARDQLARLLNNPAPNAEPEQGKLDAIAAEVAKRKAERARRAQEATAPKP